MTTQPITTQRQRELIDRLTRLVAQRAKDEVEIRHRADDRDAEAKSEYQQQRDRATAEFESQFAKLSAEYKDAREEAIYRYESDGYALAQEEERVTEKEARKLTQALDDAKHLWDDRCHQIQDNVKEQKVALNKELLQFQQRFEYHASELEAQVAAAKKIVSRRCPWPETAVAPSSTTSDLAKEQQLERFAAVLNRAREKTIELQNLRAARFLEDGWPMLIFIFFGLAAAYPFWLLLGPFGWYFVVAADVSLAVAVAFAVRQTVRPFARRQTLRVLPEFQQAEAEARGALNAARHAGRLESERKNQQLAERREKELADAGTDLQNTRDQRTARHDARVKETTDKVRTRRRTIEETHERELHELEQKYPPRIKQLEQDFQQRIAELSDTYRQRRAASREQFDTAWNELVTSWAQGLAEFQEVVGAMNQYCGANFPAWSAVDWASWRPRAASELDGEISALPIGRFDFDLATLEGGLPRAAGLEMPRAKFELPAVLSYPECPSLLLEADGDGRDAAARVIQNVMLRLATTFPPGKVRFTIIDPVGLGQNFSAFMHLADYDERLVSSRIWTESAHVNQRLADLTEHMENVIQKYLRNEFASIQEYNQHAGEVAEAFQILVIANFPANFSDDAARRLVSIASSGARCGVFTLISTDTKQKLPRNFDLADLEAQATTLVWDNEQRRFCWTHDDLRGLPLALEPPPDDDHFTAVVRAVGRHAKDAARVEVPFATVVPDAQQWWTGDSRSEIEVPLGRAGATKLQYLRLGKGTSQHVLISGKTGSGKSSLLNAMITNLAVHYAPDELQFYLIDFKKGVEFKPYATSQLPHACVIAIESEREFGISVLERLDVELKNRGDLFRQHGVQDVKGYRNAKPDADLPRILLVIDEFQEFFTTDDKISHDSSLLLDRLVRQGRAFGIHVLLGSQTLAGAYSLARSTIGQMAVRIALQCSESDAHLILSEDNTAARLLSRPGEAIYNDANGLIEGNHPFQVVWLPDHEREHYLNRVREMAGERHVVAKRPIVFEGNVAADPRDNELQRELLLSPAPTEISLAPRAWLGSAVAIKDPTDVVFRRQSGSNLLIVGQQEELALGVLANCLISLASQCTTDCQSVAHDPPPNRLRHFYILDGARPDSPDASFWRRLTGHLPLDAEVVTLRDAARAVTKLAAEVDRRLETGDQSAEPVFVYIYNLSRFRDLKKSDDLGFGGFGDDAGSASVEKQLTTILREGPSLGVHALVWCDSYNNLNRWLDRQTLRDLELRVLFQMSATDSSNLMDSPAASRLGVHRAIFYSEEQGQAEKFRPYGPPAKDWLNWVETQLLQRTSTNVQKSIPNNVGSSYLVDEA